MYPDSCQSEPASRQHTQPGRSLCSRRRLAGWGQDRGGRSGTRASAPARSRGAAGHAPPPRRAPHSLKRINSTHLNPIKLPEVLRWTITASERRPLPGTGDPASDPRRGREGAPWSAEPGLGRGRRRGSRASARQPSSLRGRRGSSLPAPRGPGAPPSPREAATPLPHSPKSLNHPPPWSPPARCHQRQGPDRQTSGGQGLWVGP